MNETYQPPDYLTPCSSCGRNHARKEERYRCARCEATVCRSFAHDGRKWNRRGELVHLLQIAAHKENPPFVRVCGSLSRVEDWKAPLAEPVARGARNGRGEPWRGSVGWRAWRVRGWPL
jgi:hypothetical protein